MTHFPSHILHPFPFLREEAAKNRLLSRHYQTTTKKHFLQTCQNQLNSSKRSRVSSLRKNDQNLNKNKETPNAPRPVQLCRAIQKNPQKPSKFRQSLTRDSFSTGLQNFDSWSHDQQSSQHHLQNNQSTKNTEKRMKPVPSPTPAKECNVVPPMWVAATPVEAVTKTAWQYFKTKITQTHISNLFSVFSFQFFNHQSKCERLSNTSRSSEENAFPLNAKLSESIFFLPCFWSNLHACVQHSSLLRWHHVPFVLGRMRRAHSRNHTKRKRPYFFS